ncbi:MAG: IgGFc-binding protein [Candidatus Kapaibacterium sp.]
MMQKQHPRFFLIAAVLFIQAIAIPSFSQSRITTTVTPESGDKTTGLGRDYWFTMAQNYQNQGGKYYNLYVTSPKNTIVFIQITGGSTSKWPITAGQILTFSVPLSWEVTTSGVVENKGIRVWSDDADLVVHLLSRNPATSDGMLIIPTTGWGKEYVVGAYGSLFQGYGSFVYDYPSEFSIVSDQDSTVSTVTPNTDIRCQNGKVTVHKAHVPFTDILNRGECIQYQAVLAQDCDNYDVTGTIISSSKQIGVVGASQCPNIPCESPYCDHICEMIPPVRTWGKTYHTLPFATRVAGDTYLVIGSKDGQLIYMNGQLYVSLDNKYNFYFRPDVQAPAVWTSDAPFFIAQYINSTTFEANNGGSNSGRGDPAMVVINSLEHYTPHIIFQTPNIQGTGGFSNYANVFVDTSAIVSTVFDGTPINKVKGASRLVIPGSRYMGFRVAQVAPGKHEVISPLPVGVYLYGYASYDSYAWSGNLGISTTNSPDTIPPAALVSGACFDVHVTLTDNRPNDSKLNSIVSDSLYNISFTPDPQFLAGAWIDSSFYDLHIIDSTKEAYAKIFAYDVAGNRTTITSKYQPQFAKIIPQLVDYGVVQVGTVSCQYVTVINTGRIPFFYNSLRLLLGNKGFTLDSTGSKSSIAAGDSLIIKNMLYTVIAECCNRYIRIKRWLLIFQSNFKSRPNSVT